MLHELTYHSHECRLIRILLLTDFSSGYGRDLLRGIVKYARSRKGWAFYRMPVYYRMQHGDREIIRWARKWNVDAIIAQIDDIDVKMLSRLNIPIIVQNYKDRIPGVCNLTGDYIGTGRMAADYFMELGYRNFAYYGIMEAVWSRERFLGFQQRLLECGYQVSTYFVSFPGNSNGGGDMGTGFQFHRQMAVRSS